MLNDGIGLMASPKRKTPDAPDDVRVAAIVLKDTPKYRDWLTGLSDATLIPVSTIVRDALAKWAADRGLPAPPSGASKSTRRTGSGPKKGKRRERGS
jgi:hypothetical protein